MAIFSKFFGRTVSEAAGVAAGLAVASPLRPVVQLVENETWAIHPDRPVNVETAAAVVAEDVEKDAWGVQQASWTGFDEPTFRAVLGEVLNAPGLGELYAMWRRGLISDADFTHGLRKAKLEPRWDTALKGQHDVLLSSEELAAMQQQGFVDAGRANSEGGLQGVTPDRQQLRFEVSGLPPGHAEAQHLLNRGLIDEATFAEMIREGHTKTKYTGVLEQARVAVLSALDFVQGHLRNWISESEMVAGGALTGHTAEQMDFLFKIHGRPISWHQTWIGLQRGGTLDGPTGDIHPAFLAALQRSDTLTQGGDLTASQTEEILKFEGWEPTLRATVAAKWAETSPTKQDPAVKSAETKFLTALHKAFVGGAITDAQGVTELALTSLSAAAQAGVLGYWRKEKALEAIPPPPSA
ncbi:MAG: hypothetical protein E6G19_13490 [Actinobacteria bacterium]|nr:MAG: hypothetical protein E6G19_13490 [Actinomycetota bacterium]